MIEGRIRVPSPASVPLPTRRRLYATFLAVGLLVLFVGAVLSLETRRDPGPPRLTMGVPPPNLPVLGFVAAAILLLLWLRPHPLRYAAGVVCFWLTFLGPWFVASGLVDHWVRSGTDLLKLIFLLPIAWGLLATSARYSWGRSITSYLGVGATFVVLWHLAGWIVSGVLSFLHGSYFVAFVLLWPHYLLGALGVFTRSLPMGQ